MLLVLRCEGKVELWETLDNDRHALNGVVEDDLAIRHSLLIVIFSFVQEFHLLEDSRLNRGRCISVYVSHLRSNRTHLSRLSSTQEQDVDLFPSILSILLELGVDELVACKGRIWIRTEEEKAGQVRTAGTDDSMPPRPLELMTCSPLLVRVRGMEDDEEAGEVVVGSSGDWEVLSGWS